ncbi:protein kinase [Streptomyces roseolus]|uniref:protein kinase n=1 Tax=Streptomyces roseolus TaxID=67358 RepID=UPI0036EADFB8
MDEYAGRVLAERYRLPLPPAGSAGLVDLAETRAFDTYSGQEVRVRQVPLPEVVDAEVLGEGPAPGGAYGAAGGATRRPAEPGVRRAIEAAQAAAQIPDHPLLDQVFDVFAEAGSLWIVSEYVAARPLSALLDEGPLNPFRAAEIAADVLTALRALHAHGWVHRNITARTVLVCDDGRVLLTGLAAGAAEEALCGYAPVPDPDDPAFRSPEDAYEERGEYEGEEEYEAEAYDAPAEETYESETYEPAAYENGVYEPGAYENEADGTEADGTRPYGPEAHEPEGPGAYGARAYEYEVGAYEPDRYGDGYGTGEEAAPEGEAPGGPPPAAEPVPYGVDPYGTAAPAPRPASPPEAPAVPPSADLRAARAGAIAAYRAATRAAAARIGDTGPLPVQRTPRPQLEPEPAPRPRQEPQPEPWPGSRAEIEPAPESRAETGPAPQPRNEPQPEPRTEPWPESRPESWPERRPEFRAATEPASEPRTEPRSEFRTEPGHWPEPRNEPQPGPWPEARNEPQPEPWPESRAETEPAPESRSEPGPASESRGEAVLPGASRPGPAPLWWARATDAEDDGDDDGDGEDADEGGDADGRRPYGGGPHPPRLMLKGSWTDGPHASRDGSPRVPAGGSPVLPGSGRPALPAGYTAATPEPARAAPADAAAAVPAQQGPVGERYRGPATRLAAERARQTRIAVVGAVTERWAPEQAGPVHENWRLAPPIGPATDLWALGALLYRAVQGHAPYPEDSAAELVQLVCAEPPAYAEECGPLRPVVESLLRQDPTERPDFEELRGWLRSLVRSAPEPEAEFAAAPPSPFNAKRLPILRRRGELVRRRRAAGAGRNRHRHRRGKDARGGGPPAPAPVSAPAPTPVPEETFEAREPLDPQALFEPRGREPRQEHEPHEEFESHRAYESHEEFESHRAYEPRHGYEPRQEYAYGYEDAEPEPPRPRTGPRSRGRRVLLVGLLLLGAALAYIAVALPRGGEKPAGARPPATTAPPAAKPTESTGTPTPTAPAPTTPPRPTSAPASPPASASGPALASGYVLREDPEGFRIGVPRDWRRSPVNAAGQVRYTGGDFTLIVVPGRDSVRDNGSDPLEYQNTKERELEPYRQSSWSELVRSRRVDIGRTPTAEGQYTWYDGAGRKVFVHNLALIEGGRYHVVQVIGPDSDRDRVAEIYGEAVKGFRPGR